MRNSVATTVAASVVLATAVGAIAGFKIVDRQMDYAQVVHVEPVEKTIRTPRKECHDAGDPQQSTSNQRCETVYDTHIERSGYDVRYRVGNEERTVRMSHDPGDRIPMRKGQLVLDARTGAG